MKLVFALIPFIVFACSENPKEPAPAPKPVAEFMHVRNYINQTESDEIVIGNISDDTLNLKGFTVGHKPNPDSYTIPANVKIGKGRGHKLTYKMFQFEMNDTSDVLYLKDNHGVLQDSFVISK